MLVWGRVGGFWRLFLCFCGQECFSGWFFRCSGGLFSSSRCFWCLVFSSGLRKTGESQFKRLGRLPMWFLVFPTGKLRSKLGVQSSKAMSDRTYVLKGGWVFWVPCGSHRLRHQTGKHLGGLNVAQNFTIRCMASA